MLWGSTGRGLAFNPNRVVGSDRDAASNGAGSGPVQTLPGCSVGVVKHGGTISLRVDRSSTDFQGGLQEQTRGQPGSSKPRAPPRRATERVGATSRDQGLRIPWGPLTQTHARHTATPLAATTDQPNKFRMTGHATHDATSSQPMPYDSMKFNIPRRSRSSQKFLHPRVPQTIRLKNRFQELADCDLTPTEMGVTPGPAEANNICPLLRPPHESASSSSGSGSCSSSGSSSQHRSGIRSDSTSPCRGKECSERNLAECKRPKIATHSNPPCTTFPNYGLSACEVHEFNSDATTMPNTTHSQILASALRRNNNFTFNDDSHSNVFSRGMYAQGCRSLCGSACTHAVNSSCEYGCCPPAYRRNADTATTCSQHDAQCPLPRH